MKKYRNRWRVYKYNLNQFILENEQEINYARSEYFLNYRLMLKMK